MGLRWLLEGIGSHWGDSCFGSPHLVQGWGWRAGRPEAGDGVVIVWSPRWGRVQEQEEKEARFQESRLPDRDMRRAGQEASFTLFRSTPTTEASPCLFWQASSVPLGGFLDFFWSDLSF